MWCRVSETGFGVQPGYIPAMPLYDCVTLVRYLSSLSSLLPAPVHKWRKLLYLPHRIVVLIKRLDLMFGV